MKRSPVRASRAAAAVVVGAVFALVTVAPAGASPAPAPDPVVPFVDCVSSAPGTSPDAFTVVFGYRNTSTATVALAPGSAQNVFSLGGDRGQPATFAPGEHHAVFATTFAGAASDLAWTLGSTTIGLDPTTPSCDTATTLVVTAPATAADGDDFDVVATVGRMLLAPPSTGSVAFSVDSTVVATSPVDERGVAGATLDSPGAGAHTLTARYIPPTATPQLLGSSATTSVTVTPASTISIASAGLSSDGRSARFTVSRTASDTAAHVDYVTADGSARAGSDYASSRGTVRFAPGQSRATIAIPLLDRPFGSPRASFYVLLQRASDPVDVAGATAVLPLVTAITTQPPSQGTTGIAITQLPPAPPGGGADAPSVPGAPAGNAGDLGLMIGGLLLTVGAAFAVFGLMRFRSGNAEL